MNKLASDILVIGGGPAGMSAALTAAAGSDLQITIVDNNPRLGGQIWRAEMGNSKSPEAKWRIKAIESGRISLLNDAQIFGRDGENCLLAETSDGVIGLEYKKLVLATGARERFLPFPGWTRAGVFGAGGLQALVKGGLDVKNKRIVIAGTGPLLLAVAAYLRSKGARVLAIAEQTSASALRKFGLGLWRQPAKVGQAIALRLKLAGVPYLTGCWVTGFDGDETSGIAYMTRNGKNWVIPCDMLACGFDLVPNTELAAMLGCEITNGFVAVDEFQRTSCENIYCAGEPTGIGGVEAAVVEGSIAGLAAAGKEHMARAMFAGRERSLRFAEALNAAFTLRHELKHLAGDSDIVCRCENVEYGRLTHFESFRDAKLQTRCGMGPCQGRVCGAACGFLFGWEMPRVRPPVFPVNMENL